jgi:hypothetical protein
MPWSMYRNMTGEGLKAIWEYLQTLTRLLAEKGTD